MREELFGQYKAVLQFMVFHFATDENATPTVQQLRCAALLELLPILGAYLKTHSIDWITRSILLKKLYYLSMAKTKTEVENILKPPKPRHTGKGLTVDAKYYVAEEELLIWSETSLLAPLQSSAVDRYMEVFENVFGFSIYDMDKNSNPEVDKRIRELQHEGGIYGNNQHAA